jgi:hypothetical protein
MATQTVRVARATNLFWLWWFLTGVLGFVGGMTIKTVIEILADSGGFAAALDAISPPVFGAFFGAMLGLCTGLAQWLVLRCRLDGVGAWAPATLLAWTLFWLLHNAEVFGFAHSPWSLVGQGFGHGAIVGAMIGVAQYLVLRTRVPGAGRWVPISIVSWSVAGGIMHFLLDVLLASAGIHGPFDVLKSRSNTRRNLRGTIYEIWTTLPDVLFRYPIPGPALPRDPGAGHSQRSPGI